MTWFTLFAVLVIFLAGALVMLVGASFGLGLIRVSTCCCGDDDGDGDDEPAPTPPPDDPLTRWEKDSVDPFVSRKGNIYAGTPNS